MGVRNQVKQLLRMCGHAMVCTVHERLDNLDRQVTDLLDQNTHLAQNQTALLQSGVHLVQRLPEIQTDAQQFEARLVSLLRDHCATKPDLAALTCQIEKTRRDLDETIENFATANAQRAEEMQQRLDNAISNLAQVVARVVPEPIGGISSQADNLVDLRLSLEQEFAANRNSREWFESLSHKMASFFENEAVRQICMEAPDYAAANPEVGLMKFLYSHLPGRKAVDIGAHVGEVSNQLLKAGYEVYAFEPYPASYARLTERLKDQQAFHPFNFALGAANGELPLHLVTDMTLDARYGDTSIFHSIAQHGLPEGLCFDRTIRVPVKTLSALHEGGVVPVDISLVKVDTEGYDLEVIRGMNGCRYPVVCAEFWDAQNPFAKSAPYTVETMVQEMRQRDYFWYIILYETWWPKQIAYFCNHERPVPGSWGNVFFFRDHDTFQQAQQWCAAVLPRTYFKQRPASAPAQ